MIETETLSCKPKAKTVIRLAVATGQPVNDWLHIVGLNIDRAHVDAYKRKIQRPKNQQPDLLKPVLQKIADQLERIADHLDRMPK